MSKLYSEDCPRCGGKGYVMHGNVTFTVEGREDRHCFQCNGSGVVTFKTSPEQREKNREAARKRREAKAIAERKVREANERFRYGGYTIDELAEIQRKKQEELRKAEAAKSEWLGEIGDKVTLVGECVFVKAYSGRFGISMFFVIKTEDGNIAKFYTSSQTFDGVEKGYTVEMTGTVKHKDKDANRDNQKVTTLERVKCQDAYKIIEKDEDAA